MLARYSFPFTVQMEIADPNSRDSKLLSRRAAHGAPAHCRGAPSLDPFDPLNAMLNWVERGTAPTLVIAIGKAFPGRSRPLCPYPTHAHYLGQGDAEDGRSFACR